MVREPYGIVNWADISTGSLLCATHPTTIPVTGACYTTVYPCGMSMRFAVRLLRCRGRPLPWRDVINQSVLVGDLRIEELRDEWQDWYWAISATGCCVGVWSLRKSGHIPQYNYIQTHLNGELSLGVTYWASNLIIAATASLAVSGLLVVAWLTSVGPLAAPWNYFVGIAFFMFAPPTTVLIVGVLPALLLWQGFGILRCTQPQLKDSPVWSWLARLHAIVAFGIVAVFVWKFMLDRPSQ